MATFQDIARFLPLEFHFHGEFSSLQAGLTCVKHTFQDILRFIFYGIPVPWRILSKYKCDILLSNVDFKIYQDFYTGNVRMLANSPCLKRDAFDSSVLFKIEQGTQHGYSVMVNALDSKCDTFVWGLLLKIYQGSYSENLRFLTNSPNTKDIEWYSCTESQFLANSLCSKHDSLVSCILSNIARFSCTESQFLGEFSSIQVGRPWIKGAFRDAARFYTWILRILANRL